MDTRPFLWDWLLAMDVLTAALVLAFRQCVIKTVGWADGGSPTMQRENIHICWALSPSR